MSIAANKIRSIAISGSGGDTSRMMEVVTDLGTFAVYAGVDTSAFAAMAALAQCAMLHNLDVDITPGAPPNQGDAPKLSQLRVRAPAS